MLKKTESAKKVHQLPMEPILQDTANSRRFIVIHYKFVVFKINIYSSEEVKKGKSIFGLNFLFHQTVVCLKYK